MSECGMNVPNLGYVKIEKKATESLNGWMPAQHRPPWMIRGCLGHGRVGHGQRLHNIWDTDHKEGGCLGHGPVIFYFITTLCKKY